MKKTYYAAWYTMDITTTSSSLSTTNLYSNKLELDQYIDTASKSLKNVTFHRYKVELEMEQ